MNNKFDLREGIVYYGISFIGQAIEISFALPKYILVIAFFIIYYSFLNVEDENSINYI